MSPRIPPPSRASSRYGPPPSPAIRSAPAAAPRSPTFQNSTLRTSRSPVDPHGCDSVVHRRNSRARMAGKAMTSGHSTGKRLFDEMLRSGRQRWVSSLTGRGVVFSSGVVVVERGSRASAHTFAVVSGGGGHLADLRGERREGIRAGQGIVHQGGRQELAGLGVVGHHSTAPGPRPARCRRGSARAGSSRSPHDRSRPPWCSGPGRSRR